MKEKKCKVCGKELTGKQRQFCSTECQSTYYKEQRLKDQPQKYCRVCGKPLTSNKKKVCSDECLKVWNSRYNSAYIAKRRKEDKDFLKRTNQWSAKSTQKSYAKRAWNNRLEQAGVIMRLAEMDNAQVLIAKYLDENFQGRIVSRRRKYPTDEEKEAGELLESVGDVISS